MERIQIGVAPRGELQNRASLLAALEGLLPVRFVALDDGDAVACIGFDGIELPDRLPSLGLAADEPAGGRGATVELASSGVDPCLRGRALLDDRVGGADLGGEDGSEILARAGNAVLWERQGERERSALAPLELEPDEPLRDRLHPGRWFALVPLVQFLRRITAEIAWEPPAPRAAFLFDDPNLHWTSYGYLRFDEIAEAAHRHDYHAAFATVPIDAWFTRSAAARSFRQNPDRLSLLVHGNDHLARELARPLSTRDRHALVGQALRRIEALERRSGVPVSKVMAAPHGVCSEEMARAMLTFEFEAVTISRPYPWLARPPAHWLAAPAGSGPLVGMRPTETVAGGLPVLLRTTLQHGEDDLVLRAFLGQPVIVSGHHDDLPDGLEPLAEIAASLNRIDGMSWGSLADISRASFSTRRREGVLQVRPHALLLSLDVPAGTEAIAVERTAKEASLTIDGVPAPFDQPVEVDRGRHQLKIAPCDPLDPHAAPRARRRPWAVGRRIAAEGRDRLRPVLSARKPPGSSVG